MIEYLKYLNMGLIMVTPAIVGVFVGALLDRALKTFPALTVAFLVLGILSGIWSLYKSVKSLV